MSAFALTDIDTVGAPPPASPTLTAEQIAFTRMLRGHGVTNAEIANAMALREGVQAALAARAAPAATPAKLPARYAASAATYAATRATGAAPYRLTDIITVHVANPKRPGTAGYLRYSMWKTGMTVAAYLAALEASPHAASCRGYGPTDLTYNLKRGLISVAQPA